MAEYKAGPGVRRRATLSVGELAAALGAELLRPEPADNEPATLAQTELAMLVLRSRTIDHATSLADADATTIVFAEDAAAADQAFCSAAGAILLPRALAVTPPPRGAAQLLTAHPRLSFARAAQLLRAPEAMPGVHASASIAFSAQVGAKVTIGAFAVLEDGARIGANSVIGAGAFVGAGVEIGADCRIYPRVTIYPGTQLGDRVVVHAGAVLGADGFGYVRDPETGAYLQFPQQGTLVIEDDVEIGANTTIDRGALEATRIHRGVKLDNLVHIGTQCFGRRGYGHCRAGGDIGLERGGRWRGDRGAGGDCGSCQGRARGDPGCAGRGAALQAAGRCGAAVVGNAGQADQGLPAGASGVDAAGPRQDGERERECGREHGGVSVVVIGGHSRNIGKTSVVAGVIAGLPERRWTAFKVTQYGHGFCTADGAPCDCQTDDHTMAISEERGSDSGTDSARYLAAGAARSLWVRTRVGMLADAMPRIRKELAATDASGGHAIVESNSILQFLQPDLYLSVLDAGTADFKESARRYLDRADAVLIVERALAPQWQGVSLKLVEGKAAFVVEPPRYLSEQVLAFVRERLISQRPYAREAMTL